jgi:hypothetical protein
MDLREVGIATPTPQLNGVDAQRDGPGTHSYLGLKWPIPFTGRLLIARGFIQSLYRHMGFHPAWKFEESWELDFEQGRLANARELSAEMSALRERIQAGEEDDPDSVERPGWIERTFKLDFRRSKGH